MAVDMPVLFSAGEPSGEVYAGLLIKALKRIYPHARIFGIGDGSMQRCGAEVVFEYKQLMTFGLVGGFLSILRNYELYRKIARNVCRVRPRTFVAVAYPGINLLLCRVAKRLGLRVYFFLPPQIWAWGAFRKYFLKKWVDAVVSVFPFEAAFYRRQGINTILIDNPLAHELRSYRRTDQRPRIGFMPGSRWSQFERNMPIVHSLMKLMRMHESALEFCLLTYDTKMARAAEPRSSDMSIIHENRYQAMMNCDLLIVSSGTASLEASLLGVPQLFFHRPSVFDFLVARRLLRIDEYCLTNLFHGKPVVPAIVHPNPERLVQYLYDKAKLHFQWH